MQLPDKLGKDLGQSWCTLRERGSRAGRDFFSRVEGIEAVRKDKKTERPTKSPQSSPTWTPIGPPTSVPSGMPTESPSGKSIVLIVVLIGLYLI